ncbi:protein translocase subunit SecF [Candidatus Uhrbacteria bacterium]|nr:protein translocase subunit SecF [Candidatus Uhrbacteria bacterium]
MIPIVQNRRIWLTCSGILVAASIVALGLWQLRLGIDFTGGSLLEIVYTAERPPMEEVRARLGDAGIAEADIKPVGDREANIRLGDVSQGMYAKIIEELRKDDPELVQKSFQSIGPVIGQELKKKSLLALAVALAMILLYITYVFRKVSYPVESWKYGIAAIVALFHDAVIVLGVFAALGYFFSIEITSSFIPAFLTVLGFSVHDTIVIFDRIRENLQKTRGEFALTVNQALNQTLVRSINTSMTVLLVLFALYFFGGDTLKTFSLALIIGVAIGTYSSIFVAAPFLTVWHAFMHRARR